MGSLCFGPPPHRLADVEGHDACSGIDVRTCPLCHGLGRCDPVPATGKQATPWEWTP